MAKLLEVLKCNICGNVVEVLHAGAGALSCCNQPMVVMTENTVDASKEKHIPVIEKVNGGFLVKVGSVDHPMLDNHYIEWIEFQADGKVYGQFLKSGDKPEAFFNVEAENVIVRAYCNLHGLWKSDI